MGGKVKVKVNFLAGWWMVSLLSVASLAAASGDLRLVDAVKNGDKETVQSLLKQRVDVNAPQPDGATALAWAVYRDDLETADLLIRASANVNAANEYGVTPLFLACTNRNAAMVERLLKAGADPNVAQWTGETPLMTAARTGNLAAVNSLLAHGADVNVKEKRRGQTALMWAVAGGYLDIVRVLIERKADVHAKSHMLRADGFTPKVYKTYEGLLQVSSKGGFTPLLFAAQNGNLEAARLLVAAGADVNEATEEDGSALLLASANGYEDLALFLLEKGANPNVKAGDGSEITPLHYALRGGIKSLMGGKERGGIVMLGVKEVAQANEVDEAKNVVPRKQEKASPLPGPNMPKLMKALIAHGADPNAPLGKQLPTRLRMASRPFVSLIGATPFLLASAANDSSAMKLLVEARANPNTRTVVDEIANPIGVTSEESQFQGGLTPLLAAAGLGFQGGATAQLVEGNKSTRVRSRKGEETRQTLESVKMLVELGADVNEANETGWTPLHAAAFAVEDPVIQFLVEKGAKLDVKNGCGQTPLSLADSSIGRGLTAIPLQHSRESTEELLRKLGASTSPLTTPVGRCVEGRSTNQIYIDRDRELERNRKIEEEKKKQLPLKSSAEKPLGQ